MNRDFKEIYSKINLENLDKINKIIKRKNITLIILLILLLIFIFFRKIVFINDVVMIIFSLFFLGLLILNIFFTIKYKKIFKIILKKIVNLYNENLEYFYNKGIEEREYKKSGFYKEFDKYYSEDLIKGKLLNRYFFKMAQVRTKETEVLRDDKGKITGKQDYIVFDGLYGEVELNVLNSLEIEVATNTIKSKYKKSRIEMESAEFENKYDIFSNDKIKALEVFTSEIVDKMNEFRINLGKPIQIRIKNGKLFFNVYLGEILEPPKLKNSIDYDILNKYFKTIDQPISLISEILKNIDEVK